MTAPNQAWLQRFGPLRPTTVLARATVVAALFALFTLQLTASDHFHSVDETAQCEVCSHAGDTTSIALVESANTAPGTPIKLAFCPIVAPACASLNPDIRGPPTIS